MTTTHPKSLAVRRQAHDSDHASVQAARGAGEVLVDVAGTDADHIEAAIRADEWRLASTTERDGGGS